MKYKAYIKTLHTPTPIHYLGVTTKKNVEKYKGSSKYFKWLQEDFPEAKVTTRIVFECDDRELFNRLITNYSFFLGPEDLKNYVNKVPEMGFQNPEIAPWLKALGIKNGHKRGATSLSKKKTLCKICKRKFAAKLKEKHDDLFHNGGHC